jgi:hypothetical protein
MNGPARPAEITGCRLFVHEYRCMAALARRGGAGNAPQQCETKAGNAGPIRYGRRHQGGGRLRSWARPGLGARLPGPRNDPTDRERGFRPAESPIRAGRRRHRDRVSAWRCRHPQNRRPRREQVGSSSICRRFFGEVRAFFRFYPCCYLRIAAVGQSFLPLPAFQCKGRRNPNMIRKKREPVFHRDKRGAFARRSCSNNRMRSRFRFNRIMIREPI